MFSGTIITGLHNYLMLCVCPHFLTSPPVSIRILVCTLTLSARQATIITHRACTVAPKGLNPSRQDAPKEMGHSRPGRLHPRTIPLSRGGRHTALVYMLSGCINFTTPHSKRDREGRLIAFIGPFRPEPTPQTLFIGICCGADGDEVWSAAASIRKYGS